MNRVTLYGHVGADPTLSNTNDYSLLKIRLATNERRKKGDDWVDHTEWHTVTVWGARAEALASKVKKGDSLLVEGPIRTTSYEKEGVKRYRVEVQGIMVVITKQGTQSDW